MILKLTKSCIVLEQSWLFLFKHIDHVSSLNPKDRHFIFIIFRIKYSSASIFYTGKYVLSLRFVNIICIYSFYQVANVLPSKFFPCPLIETCCNIVRSNFCCHQFFDILFIIIIQLSSMGMHVVLLLGNGVAKVLQNSFSYLPKTITILHDDYADRTFCVLEILL